MLGHNLYPRKEVPQGGAPGLNKQEPVPIWVKGLINHPPGGRMKTAAPQRTVRMTAHVDQRDSSPHQSFVQIFIRAVIFPIAILEFSRGLFQM